MEADQDLCNELFDLSGWKDTDKWSVYEKGDLPKGKIAVYNIGYTGPLYDLGYLLRKLPTKRVKLRNYTHGWACQFSEDFKDHGKRIRDYVGEADTPEDAAAKLAIELFKQGVLTRESYEPTDDLRDAQEDYTAGRISDPFETADDFLDDLHHSSESGDLR